MLGRERLDGEPLPLEHDRFAVAAEVAAIEGDLAAHMLPPRVAFDRSHVEALRVAGATRAEVADYAATLFNAQQVARLVDDLDSYGKWAG